jgi:hypothetical protein
MSSSTPNYGFTLPAVADPIDEDLWGGQLNTNFSELDTLLGARTASKYGALIAQNSTDDGFTTITSQGTSGQVLVSNGADTLPSFQSISTAIGSALYPVGTYYMNETDSTDPATLLGFGTWVAVTDKFIVAHGSTYTSTGGAATVTLSSGNMPPHSHTFSLYGTISNSQNNVMGGQGSSYATHTTSSAGSGTPFDIIPPYQAAYIWKRTA